MTADSSEQEQSIVKIDEREIQSQLSEFARGSVEETLNVLLDAEPIGSATLVH